MYESSFPVESVNIARKKVHLLCHKKRKRDSKVEGIFHILKRRGKLYN